MGQRRIEPGASALSFCFGGGSINELAAAKLVGFIEEHLFAPEASWDQHQFEKRSYQRWAAFELLERIMDHPLEEPEMLVEEFIITAGFYSGMNADSKTGFLFETAKETAEDILQLFHA